MAMNFVALRIVSTCFHRLLSMANCPAKRFVVWEKKHARALLVEEA